MVSHTKVFVWFDGYSLDSGADPEFLVRGGGGVQAHLTKMLTTSFFRVSRPQLILQRVHLSILKETKKRADLLALVCGV